MANTITCWRLHDWRASENVSSELDFKMFKKHRFMILQDRVVGDTHLLAVNSDNVIVQHCLVSDSFTKIHLSANGTWNPRQDLRVYAELRLPAYVERRLRSMGVKPVDCDPFNKPEKKSKKQSEPETVDKQAKDVCDVYVVSVNVDQVDALSEWMPRRWFNFNLIPLPSTDSVLVVDVTNVVQDILPIKGDFYGFTKKLEKFLTFSELTYNRMRCFDDQTQAQLAALGIKPHIADALDYWHKKPQWAIPVFSNNYVCLSSPKPAVPHGVLGYGEVFALVRTSEGILQALGLKHQMDDTHSVVSATALADVTTLGASLNVNSFEDRFCINASKITVDVDVWPVKQMQDDLAAVGCTILPTSFPEKPVVEELPLKRRFYRFAHKPKWMAAHGTMTHEEAKEMKNWRFMRLEVDGDKLFAAIDEMGVIRRTYAANSTGIKAAWLCKTQEAEDVKLSYDETTVFPAVVAVLRHQGLRSVHDETSEAAPLSESPDKATRKAILNIDETAADEFLLEQAVHTYLSTYWCVYARFRDTGDRKLKREQKRVNKYVERSLNVKSRSVVAQDLLDFTLLGMRHRVWLTLG